MVRAGARALLCPSTLKECDDSLNAERFTFKEQSFLCVVNYSL